MNDQQMSKAFTRLIHSLTELIEHTLAEVEAAEPTRDDVLWPAPCKNCGQFYMLHSHHGEICPTAKGVPQTHFEIDLRGIKC